MTLDDITAADAETNSVETERNSSGCPNDELQDVFAPDGSGTPLISMAEGFCCNEYSDIPRLRSKHETEGYRDGISQGKVNTVQRAFDKGYGLGAIIGSRVGLVLGLLEGLARGVGVNEAGRIQKLLTAAEKELSICSIFGAEWWGEQGVRKYEIQGEVVDEGTLHEVVKAHPLLKKWETLLEGEIQRWNLNLKILDSDQLKNHDMLVNSNNGGIARIIDRAERREYGEEKKASSSNAKTIIGNVCADLPLIRDDLNW